MARLVKTETEMEGRYQEVWVLVDEEDDLETWQADDDLALVGRPAPRHDGAARAAGRVRFTVDVRLAGMLHAAVLRSPVAHGRVRSLDLEAARAIPGVRAVLGPETELSFTTRRPLLAAEPQYAGQPIAVVAADTLEQALAAVAALAPDIEALPHVVDPDEALASSASRPSRRRRREETSRPRSPRRRCASSSSSRLPAHLQTALEPHAAVASWDGDELTAWVSTQGMFAARDELARSFGLRKDQVRVITEYVGGGFGAKQGAGFEALVAAELARITGRPVRLVNDRHAEQLDGGRRAATRQSVRLGARRDGTIVAVDADAVVAMGQGGWVFPVLVPALTLYRCDDVRAMTFPVKTNLRAQNAFRAPGVMEGTAVFEQAIDELAAALGIEPLELRRRNHVDVDQVQRAAVLEQAAARLLRPGGGARRLGDRDALREPQADGLLRGMGCATQIWWGGGGPPSHATVRLDGDGHAPVVTGIQDIGTGTLTAARIVAAEELGLPLDHVRVSAATRPRTSTARSRAARRRHRRCCRPSAPRPPRCGSSCCSSRATSSRSPSTDLEVRDGQDPLARRRARRRT